MAKTKTVKSCDLPLYLAVELFRALNPDDVRILYDSDSEKARPFEIITDKEPKDLVYPEGWYYAKGNFRNKSTSTTGFYGEMIMLKSDETFWADYAKYCTLNS